MQEQGRQIDVKLVTEIRDGSRTEVVKVQSRGTLYIDGETTTVTYEEYIENAGNVKTIIRVKPREALIMRTGAISMRQSLYQGEITEGRIKTPTGTMEMSTKTENIFSEYKSNKGKLMLTYLLKLQNEDVGRYRIILTFKEVLRNE
jgi:uncharacterized beta-barrel protein YwiB (DUF1934 family)